MITVKQYADERGITIQAVHQSMNGKRKKERLDGHVQVIDGVKWLDEDAVAILDESRNRSPIVWEKADANERIEELEREREAMLIKIAAQADRISELAQWKADNAMLIAGAEQTKTLLDNAQRDVKLLEGFVADAKAEIAVLSDERDRAEEKTRQKEEAAQKAQEELTAAQEAFRKQGITMEEMREEMSGLLLEQVEQMKQMEEKDRKIQELENRSIWQVLAALFRKKEN